MRKSFPVYFDEKAEIWHVFTYNDVRKVLWDYKNFSSEFEMDGILKGTIINLDPPAHDKLRALVADPFSPNNINQLSDKIKSIVDEILSNVKGNEIDIIKDLAIPVPVRVIASLLGLPEEDLWKFKDWTDSLVGVNDYSSDKIAELINYLSEIIAERKIKPKKDLISLLLGSTVDGEKLTDRQLLGFVVLLLIAGNETTTNLIGNGVLTLLENKDSLYELKKNKQKITTAIEEILRYRSPVQGMFRVTKNDVELSGKKIKKGSIVLAWIGSANRDENQFPNPDKFIIDRSPNPHLAFGSGVHTCLGAPLARLEGKIVLSTLLERFSNMELADQKLEPISNGLFYGVKSLKIYVS
ncbi:cytochrome P450 [Sulfurisphaera ohwakuensis]|uniref:cytochrome P450 n=1 Tax=Sulfurisphaera ohwakuensis TaxID=69656 RepID=UPI0036F3A322